jgi:hypothetical protein
MTPFRKAVDAWVKKRTDAALDLLKQAQPLTPSQTRIWARVTSHR